MNIVSIIVASLMAFGSIFSPQFGAATTDLSDTINTFRQNYNTLNQQVISTTSTDPGHKHTTAGISGAINVDKGGTGVATFTEGVVIASGTDAFSTIAPSSNGQLLIASGTQFVANTLTAGSNTTIVNGAGTITITAAAAFGGDSSDGALTATTTILDLATNSVKIFQFSSLTMTGTSTITFTNPHPNGTLVIFRVGGDANIACTSAPCIDLSGMGATGGAVNGDGKGPDLFTFDRSTSTKGILGGGVQIPDSSIGFYTTSTDHLWRRVINILPGAGGGGGTTSGSGVGGRGGGALLMEIGGTLTYTVSNGISVAGKNGVNEGTNGGGGGGAAGICLILYNAGSPTGTCNDAGGNGGSGGGGGEGGGGGGHIGGKGGSGAGGNSNGGGGANVENVGGTGGGSSGTGAASTGGLIVKNNGYF